MRLLYSIKYIAFTFLATAILGCAQQPVMEEPHLLTNTVDSAVDVSLHEALVAKPNMAPWVDDLPFYYQPRHYCGPASVAMVSTLYTDLLDSASHRELQAMEVSDRLEALASWTILPKKNGSYTVEIQSLSRQLGLFPYVLEPDFNAILDNIDKQPVIVLQNLRFSWWPKWHYSIVIGYDADKDYVILRSGNVANYSVPVKLFKKTWLRAGGWAIVPLPATRIPESVPVLSLVRTIEQMAEAGDSELAMRAYEHAVKTLQKEASLSFAAGNLAFEAGLLDQAENYFRQAVESSPEFALAWNNLAYILLHKGDESAAKDAIKQALELAPEARELQASYRDIFKKLDPSGSHQ